ncbi:hypothetical protein [Polaribacter porphyrae]|uniref:ABC transporter permease n=1 Tax=Polaribacter porphyrae TaxID=1137780 RepID=A0A2S7WK45_9FLAO|nr:hypothetical protein [Polaribacter porphyrae]PQJ77974.1 hypothetical protein BTO18_01680 [Polaribacter porphyrae]
MKIITIFLYEWSHFKRSPFKIIAVLLFVVAGVYGLHNGFHLYKEQTKEIEKVKQKALKEKETTLAYFNEGKKGPKAKPWVNVSMPFWAIWHTPTPKFKTPEPTLVYSVGQAEQYGFYKNVTVWSSVYDADMAEEIANPERLQIGTLDFSFVVLYLLPLLLLILLYNIKGLENEQGFLSLIYVQTGSKNWWLFTRVSFYALLSIVLILGLMLYGAILTNVFQTASSEFWSIFTWFLEYLFIWFIIYFFILKLSKSTIATTLQMLGFWVVFAFIVPAAVHQYVSIKKPNNLMVAYLDLQRDGYADILKEEDSIIKKKIFRLYSELNKIPDSLQNSMSLYKKRYSSAAILNSLLKDNSEIIERENGFRNTIVENTYLFNPVTYFQNRLNKATKTHYYDYQDYRNEIQQKIDKKLTIMLTDIWKETKVNKQKYLNYLEELKD